MKLVMPRPKAPRVSIAAELPGPDRKRLPAEYRFQVTYRHTHPDEPGCLAVWDVLGGRDTYQIAVERTSDTDVRWHCSCADAVYRGEDTRHICKHVRGLMDSLNVLGMPGPVLAAA